MPTNGDASWTTNERQIQNSGVASFSCFHLVCANLCGEEDNFEFTSCLHVCMNICFSSDTTSWLTSTSIRNWLRLTGLIFSSKVSFVIYLSCVHGLASSPAVAADLMPNMTEDIVAVSTLPYITHAVAKTLPHFTRTTQSIYTCTRSLQSTTFTSRLLPLKRCLTQSLLRWANRPPI